MAGLSENSSISGILAVTPHDTNALRTIGTKVIPCRAIYVGATGNVNIIDDEGTTVLMTALAAGVWHPVSARVILNTSTTATTILAGF